MRFVLVLLIALAAGSNALQLRNRAFVAGHNLGATVSISSGKFRGCTGVVKKISRSRRFYVCRDCEIDGCCSSSKCSYYSGKRLKAVKAAVKEEPIEETEKEDKREPKPAVEPSTAGSKVLDLMTKENNKAHVTSMYKDKAYVHAKSSANLPKIGANRLIVRRGQEFTVRSSAGAPTISFNPCGMFKSEVRSTSECGVKSKVAISDWKIKGQDGTTQLNRSFYSCWCLYYQRGGRVVLLFNPFNSRSDVGGSSRMKLGKKYVLEEKSMIYQGTSDDHDGHVWDLDPFRGLNLIVALRLLRHLKLEQRGQAYIVSRHLTFSIGDEVCYGKWGDGSYTSGRPAGGYRCSKNNAQKLS